MKTATDNGKWDIVLSLLNDSQEVFYQDERAAIALKYGKELRAVSDACDKRERAALARAEAAEADAARLRNAGRLVQAEFAVWRDGYRELNEQRLTLAARVAELEAALAARPPGYLAALDARDAALSVLQRIAALVDVPGNAPAEEIVSAVERSVAGPTLAAPDAQEPTP